MENNYPATRSSDAPATPFWMTIIRGVQLLFAILVLGLASAAAHYFYADGYGMAIFTFIWTLLFFLYIFLTPKMLPQIYLFWGHVAFEATVWLFWLVTFALLADYVRGFNTFLGSRRGGTFIDCTRAAFAFALLNWLLFCVTLAVTIWLSRGNPTTVDGTHHHSTPAHTSPRTGGGFSLGKLFARNKGAHADVEKESAAGHTGPVNETGQPMEMQSGVGGANGGYTNGHDNHLGAGTGAGYTNGSGYGENTEGYGNQSNVTGAHGGYPQAPGQSYQQPGWEDRR